MLSKNKTIMNKLRNKKILNNKLILKKKKRILMNMILLLILNKKVIKNLLNQITLHLQVLLFLMLIISTIFPLSLKLKQGRKNKFTVFFANSRKILTNMQINLLNLRKRVKNYHILVISKCVDYNIFIYLKHSYFNNHHNNLFMLVIILNHA